MIAVALKGLAGRKLRAALTTLAIVLGVAMVSGTYVFTDTTEKAIDTLFTGAYTGSDAVISGKKVVSAPTNSAAPAKARRNFRTRARSLVVPADCECTSASPVRTWAPRGRIGSMERTSCRDETPSFAAT